MLCERLRVARGLPQQSKYPRRLIEGEPVLAQLAPRLQRRTTFSFVTPTSLRDVFAHWSRTTGLVLLVDWRSLSDTDLGPASKIECAVTNRAWGEALDGVLEPLGLAWAPVNGQTLWIASQETVAATPFVEFYPLAAAAGESLTKQIEAEHPTVDIAYDRASETLIVRGDANAQREVFALWRSRNLEAPE